MLAMMAGVLASMSALGSEPMRVVEGEVIAAYLNTVEPDEAPKKALIIEQTTADVDEALTSGAGEQAREMLRKQLPQATEKVIDDFLRVLARPAALSIPSRLVRPNIRMQMVRVADIDRLFDTKSLGAAWENFYKAYPNAACLIRNFARGPRRGGDPGACLPVGEERRLAGFRPFRVVAPAFRHMAHSRQRASLGQLTPVSPPPLH
ncbi:hypothetical protein [Variovorax sp. W1I1]|uniref:hypothetical protein n=1 Tax=Variovorax sp. W1I1 TaxID=3042309 RepID=UPI0027D82EC5|nr:hypothetical protein [Variovorax sp. W1I1]